MLKYAYSAAALTFATVNAAPTFANEEADQALRQRKLEQYASAVAEKYPAKMAYILHNKTPAGQDVVDAIYAALKKRGGESYTYTSYTPGENLGDRDYQSVEKTDVFFCGCTSDEADAIQAAVAKQGFTGQFVALSYPQ